MWTIGHISLGYILSRPMFGEKPLKPITLLSVFFMAIVLDGVHIYVFRNYMHNLVFFFLFTIVMLWILKIAKIISKNEMIPLFMASFAHVIADVLFGSFALFIPISYSEVGFLSWGSYLDLAFESLLGVVMLISLVYTGDLEELKKVRFYKSGENRIQRFFQNFILIILILIALGQIGAVVYLDFLNGINFYNYKEYNDGSMWYVSFLFLLVQIVFAYIIIYWIKNRWKSENEKS